MKNKISRIIPVGFNTVTEIWIFISSISIGLIRSLLFFLVYEKEYNQLYEIEYGKRILIKGKMMTDFYNVVESSFNGFLVAVFIFVSLAIYHYAYHYKDSKSIYTMKRLTNKKELYIRCLTVPAVGIILSIVLSICLLVVFYYYYMTKTPAECLYPNQLEKFLTEILYGGI